MVEKDSRSMKFQTRTRVLRQMNNYEHNKIEETLVQRSFKFDKSLEIVEQDMIRIQKET